MSPLTLAHLTPQTTISLIILYGARLSEGQKKTPCDTKDKLKAKITTEFTNLNKEIVRKAYRTFESWLEGMVEDNGNLFE